MQTTPLQQNPMKNFLGLGFLEAGFVVLLLIIIFFLLNFMGILNLNKAFPKLSSLPKLSSVQKQISTFQDNQNRKMLTSYIQQALLPTQLPSNLNQLITRFGNIYIAEWTNGNASYSTDLNINPTKNAVQRFSLTISVSSASSISGDLTSSLAKTYLKNPPIGAVVCGQKASFSYCQHFENFSSSKIGYGLTQDSKTKQVLFFSCLIPPTNPAFTRLKSCFAL